VHRSLRLLCQIHARKLTFDVSSEWESVISKNLKILLNFDLDGVQVRLFVAEFVVSILSFPFCLLTFVIQFTTSMLENAETSQSMRAIRILLTELRAVFEFVTLSNRRFPVEVTDKRNEQVPSIIVMDGKRKSHKLKLLTDLSLRGLRTWASGRRSKPLLDDRKRFNPLF
jgi:hypothetical protein